MPAEDGHDTGLTKRVLARAIDVGIAQDRVPESVVLIVQVEVMFYGMLADPIRAYGVERVVLVAG